MRSSTNWQEFFTKWLNRTNWKNSRLNQKLIEYEILTEVIQGIIWELNLYQELLQSQDGISLEKIFRILFWSNWVSLYCEQDVRLDIAFLI